MSKFSLIFIGSFLLILSIFAFFNIIYSYYFNIFLNVDTYTYTFFICSILGIFLIYFKKIKFKKVSIYEKIITVLLGYFFFPLIISVPFYFSIYNISFLTCYFEAISGFTSTGFTVFDNIKHIDKSLIIWRSSSQWIGGLYFLFSILLLIDIFDKNLKKSLTDYLSFNSSEIFKQSFKIFIIYFFLTLIIFIFLKFLNLRTFDAFNISLTIISSGGFLPINNLETIINTDIKKIILSLTLLVSFFSLFLTYNIFFFRSKSLIVFSEDFYLAFYFIFLVIIFFIFFNNNNFPDLLLSITSTISNMGFYFNDSKPNLYFLYLILVIIGGSFFSTSSGIRFLKLLTLTKFSINNLVSHINPKQILTYKITFGESNISDDNINKYFLTVFIFVISLFSITSLLTFFEINFSDAFKIGILTIMNTTNSSLFGLEAYDFQNINSVSKIILMFFMIIGRVELLTLLILLKKYLFKN